MGNNFNLTPFYRNFIGLDRLFDELTRIESLADNNGYPPCNVVRESEDHYTIELAVAGFRQEEIDIQAKDGVITITATKNKEGDEREYLHKGIGFRAFTKTFRLADHMEVKGAALRDGLLSISLERIVPEEQKPKRIAIAAS